MPNDVRQLETAFVASWSEATGELFTGRWTVRAREGGVTRAGLLYTSLTLGSTATERYLAIATADAHQGSFNDA